MTATCRMMQIPEQMTHPLVSSKQAWETRRDLCMGEWVSKTVCLLLNNVSVYVYLSDNIVWPGTTGGLANCSMLQFENTIMICMYTADNRGRSIWLKNLSPVYTIKLQYLPSMASAESAFQVVIHSWTKMEQILPGSTFKSAILTCHITDNVICMSVVLTCHLHIFIDIFYIYNTMAECYLGLYSPMLHYQSWVIM